MIAVAGFLFAAGIALPTVTGDNPPLEPSVQNEVDHAIYLGEKWLEDFAKTNAVVMACATNGICATNAVAATNCVMAVRPCTCAAADLFATNSLDREQIALKLVRAQRANGFWLDPRDASVTNRVPVQCATRLAVSILSSL